MMRRILACLLFLLGKKDINSYADWEAFKQAAVDQNIEGILGAYNAAYARYLASK